MNCIRVSCVRKDAIHKATTAIAKSCSVVVIETLNVAGMMKNRHLARALGDASMPEFHRQLTYKMAWAGGEVVNADRWFPSSKMCSECGSIKSELKLSDRPFVCSECGFDEDRDLNAAINLRDVAAGSAVSACRHRSSGRAETLGETTDWAGISRNEVVAMP